MAVNPCLYVTTTAPVFLSCLRGSERSSITWGQGYLFLSCLRGSEPVTINWDLLPNFLSCLRGSEQVV